MLSNFEFKAVKKYLEKKDGTVVLEGFNKLADAAIIFTPFVLGPQFLPLLELLDTKDRIIDICKSVTKFIAKQSEPTYIERAEQIKYAYGMICFTAYFEALNDCLPNDIVKEFTKQIRELQEKNIQSINDNLITTQGLSDQPHEKIPYTDEVMSIEDVKHYLLEYYKGITKKLSESLSNIFFINKTDDKNKKKKEKIEIALHKVPENAISRYEAQYIELATSFDDFGIYAQLAEFKSIKNQNKKTMCFLDEIQKQIGHIDIGLKNFSDLLSNIDKTQHDAEAKEIIDELQNFYKNEVAKPIINEKEDEKNVTNKTERKRLVFPKAIEAFIPQSYKCFTYEEYNDIKSLETPELWRKITEQQDIGIFFFKYLSSPLSIDYPLIVLGHPGSGKSLLTKILSAQSMCDAYTVIRIPLRDINAEDDIGLLLEKQIVKDTEMKLTNGFAGFAKYFIKKPLFIIFDGYDELLQATGRVFAGYLKKIHSFQQHERMQGRPLRVMVTSRITLIDKAEMPANSTILRLMEFDQRRQDKWIRKWNETNAEYFQKKVINPFSLPKEGKVKDSINELAEQPLLLLMLALYDSEKNELAHLDINLKRTDLYDNLLRRFCSRERSRYDDNFENAVKEETVDKIIIENEMKRLGVVAIGMFNRKNLYVHSKELLSDLEIYELGKETKGTLKDAESLIGNFFFVHKPEAKDAGNDTKEKEVAYEFLHNTFGEFLTADFILRFVIQEAADLLEMNQNSRLKNRVNSTLYDPNGLCDAWFINLMFTPLYSRPVVLEMIREHLPQIIAREKIDIDEFTKSFRLLVESQLKIFLENKKYPSIMGKVDSFQNISLLGHASTYTINLIILAAIMSEEGFVFNEKDYGSEIIQDSETRPWDKLTNLWKTWFSSKNLSSLSAVIKAKRDNSFITIKCYDRFEVDKNMNQIETQLSIASAFSDELLMGLSGLQTPRFCDVAKLTEDDVKNLLEQIDINLFTSYIIILIRREINLLDYDRLDFSSINKLIGLITHPDRFFQLNNDVSAAVIDIIEVTLFRKMIYIDTKLKMAKFIYRIFREYQESKEKRHFLVALENIQNIIFLSTESISFFPEGNYRILELDPFLRPSSFYHGFGRMSRMMRMPNPVFYLPETYSSNDEIIEMYFRKLNEKSILELLYTDPELISHYIFSQTHTGDISRGMVESYLDCLVHLLKKHGLKYLGTFVLMYTLQITKKVHAKKHEQIILGLTIDEICNERSGFATYVFFNNPKLLNVLIDILPQKPDNKIINIFRNIESIIDIKIRRSIKRYYNKFFLFEYIKIYKKISNGFIVNEEKNCHYISRIIIDDFEFISRNENAIRSFAKTLTISQYNDLKWFTETTQGREIKRIMQVIERETEK